MEEGQDSEERGRRDVTWTKSQIVSAYRLKPIPLLMEGVHRTLTGALSSTAHSEASLRILKSESLGLRHRHKLPG